jgi:hypothetical protein
MAYLDWNAIITSGDAAGIWNAIYLLTQNRNPLQPSRFDNGSQPLSIDDLNSDIAQEVFLRLIVKDRLSYFIANNFTSEQIESELILNELTVVLTSRTRKATGVDYSEDDDTLLSACENPTFPMEPAAKPA